jgi:mRNA interferase HigB
VISRKAIIDFGRQHPDAEAPLDAWYRTVLRAKWRNIVEVRQVIPLPDGVGDLTVFNVAGNKHRLIARINYRTQKVFIRAI